MWRGAPVLQTTSLYTVSTAGCLAGRTAKRDQQPPPQMRFLPSQTASLILKALAASQPPQPIPFILITTAILTGFLNNGLRRLQKSSQSLLVSFASGAIVRFMTATADRVLQDALGLSEQERAEIAARLIESLDAARDGEAAEIEAAWAAEIERRCAALDAGTTGTTDWEDVRRQIKAEILRK